MFEAFMASIAGPYHIKNNIPNQDAVLFHEDSGLMIAAVADGAGSLQKSDKGAQDAVEKAVHGIQKMAVNTTDLVALTAEALDVARSSQLSFPDYKDYGSTLVVVALRENGDWAASAVGDSFAVIHKEDGSHTLVTGTPKGEYANITELLTSEPINPVHSAGSGAIGFSLSSDGLESVGISREDPTDADSRQAHSGFWNGIVSRAKSGKFDVAGLFDWLDDQDKIIDDTTLLTVVKR